MIRLNELNSKQLDAYNRCLDYASNLDNREPLIISGYAGTGKSTVLKLVVDELESRGLSVAVVSYTGKAASLLVSRGVIQAKTIHSTIYNSIRVDGKYINRLISPSEFKYDLIVLDEYSMISDLLMNDLMSMKVPIIMFGDSYQLPPVQGQEIEYVPDIILDEIVRNPGIISQIATSIRLNGYTSVMQLGLYTSNDSDESVVLVKPEELDDILRYLGVDYSDTQFLTFTNKTKDSYNNFLRSKIMNTDELYPIVGDKLIALANNWQKGIVNGHIYEVTSDPEDYWTRSGLAYKYEVKLTDTDEVTQFLIDPGSFDHVHELPDDTRDITPVDYAYCLTVHKSQGSEWDTVVIIDDYPFNLKLSDLTNYNRWLYTAITRASKNVILIRV